MAVLQCQFRIQAQEANSQPEDAVKTRDLFETHVRPTLVKHCIQCHGATKQKNGLRVDSLESLLTGGESGAAIVLGDSSESLLVEALRHESFEMPPDNLLDKKIADGIAAWIDAGSPWPRGLVLKPTPKLTDQDREWWCYQPIGNPSIPMVPDDGWCRNEIDRFILARLRKHGIQPSKEAEPEKLARRLHFGLTGLPPVDLDPAVFAEPDWYNQLLNELLQEPAYGENQARFWLDLVRYADSDGYNADHARPQAYRYRDYVIESFNADKPYDRFVMEQLAGDEMDPGNREALTGTMFLRHWIYEWNQRDVEGQWQQILNDVTETTADVFLAQGIKCARCHDHKFDPLLQRDYFALKAFFTPLQPREDLPIADVKERAEYLSKLRKWEKATEAIRARLHEIETPVLLRHATREGFDKFTHEIQTMISARRIDRTPYEHQIASLASNQFDLHPDKLPEWLDEETEAERKLLRKKLASFDHLKPSPLPTLQFVVSDVGPVAPPTTIPDSGDASPVDPSFPAVLDEKSVQIQPPHPALRSTGRRTALARWLIDPENPLTARVIVNRIWQQHFGRGLVATTSDFGRLGSPPSHPKLLDWLARRFMKDGWSLKKLHQLILSSATYRQSSLRQPDEKLTRLDPQNILLWRMNQRRLTGEEIHDCLLQVSGGMTSSKKRAIYKPVKRNRLDPLLAAFDFPDRVESNGLRHRTTTSPQALLLMNDPWLQDRAKAFSKKFHQRDSESLIRTAYQRLYFREPEPKEIAQAVNFIEAYQQSTPIVKPIPKTGKLPDGSSAISLDPSVAASVKIPPIKELQEASGNFSIEAVIKLRSLYPDATVRTIASNWSGKQTEQGWSLGVTSTKSAFQPRNLILQLIGARNKKQGKPEYEVVASGLRVELNKPYYIAVSVDLKDTSKDGINFCLLDLSKPDAKPQFSTQAHKAKWNVQADRFIEIGGRATNHRWDGLIGQVRFHRAALGNEKLGTAASSDAKVASSKDKLLFDIRFADEKGLGRDTSGNHHHAEVTFAGDKQISRQERARIALLHALLCSNETIYVD